jgi:hypothetical protein
MTNVDLSISREHAEKAISDARYVTMIANEMIPS